MFIFVLSYSNVQQTAALNKGEMYLEIGLIQYTELLGGKKVIKPKTYQRILEKAGWFCISSAKAQTGLLFFFIYIFV